MLVKGEHYGVLLGWSSFLGIEWSIFDFIYMGLNEKILESFFIQWNCSDSAITLFYWG
jgi:hypothetical protein